MEVLNISCNMCTRDLPDMYALSPRACGPQALGIHIWQIPRTHVTTITYIYIYTHTHTDTYIYNVYMYICIYVYMYVCIGASNQVFLNLQACIIIKHNPQLYMFVVTNTLD